MANIIFTLAPKIPGEGFLADYILACPESFYRLVAVAMKTSGITCSSCANNYRLHDASSCVIS